MFIIIAGISISKSKEYAFIQVVSNFQQKNKLIKFPITDLKNKIDSNGFSIANNHFNSKNITINLDELNVNISFSNREDWKRSLINPNIMGFLSFVPKVECKHDVLTIDAEINGSFKIKENEFTFHNGKGYVEKNWGRSFPNEYLWVHANQFKDNDISLQFAIAKPKWLLFSPTVYIGYVKFNKISLLGSHRLSLISIYQSNNSIFLKITKLKRIIYVEIKLKMPVTLFSPEDGEIKSLINEYLNSEVDLVIEKRKLFKPNTTILVDNSSLSTAEVQNVI